MNVKTTDEYVLERLAEAEARIEELEDENSDLRNRLAGAGASDWEPDPGNVSLWRIDQPIEICHLSVADEYDLSRDDDKGPGKSAGDLERIAGLPSDDPEFVELSEGCYGWAYRPGIDVVLRTLPFRFLVLGQLYGASADTYNGSVDLNVYMVESDSSEMTEGRYFPIERKGEMLELGERLFRERLLKAAGRIRERLANSDE